MDPTRTKLQILDFISDLQSQVEASAHDEQDRINSVNTVTWAVNVWNEFLPGFIAMIRASEDVRPLASKGLRKKQEILKNLIESESK